MTTITTASGRTRTLPDHVDPSIVLGLDADGRIVVDWFDTITRVQTEGPRPADALIGDFVFGLTLCCDASDKGMEDGVGCRACYGLPGETITEDGRTWTADAGHYLIVQPDGSVPELDPTVSVREDVTT